MHSTTSFVALFCLLFAPFTFAATLSARSALCVTQDINTVKAVVAAKSQTQFCTWWLSLARTNTPFVELNAAQVTNACKCILGRQRKRDESIEAPELDSPIDGLRRRQTTCTTAGNNKLKADFSETQAFCKFFNAATRASSPFPDWAVADLINQCTCVLASTTTTTTTKTTTTTTKPTTTTTTTTTAPKATTTTTTTKSTTLTPSVTTTASATASVCATQNTATLLPVANTAVDRNALSNLQPTTTAVLNYAQASPGTNAASIQYDMLYPDVILENSAFISSYSCAAGKLSLTLAQDKGSVALLNAWPQSGLVLITKTSTCNTPTTRGVFLVSGWTSTNTSLTYTYTVANTTWQNVAKTMKISYGTVNKGSGIQPASSSQCVSSFSHSSTTTASTTTTTVASSTTSSAPFVTPTSFDDLSPGAQQIVLLLLYKTKYNPDGSIKLFQVNATGPNNATTIPMATYSPDNSTLQAALLAQLDNAGLPKPAGLVQAAQNAMTGLCPALTSSNSSSSTNSTALSAASPLGKRFSELEYLFKRDDTFDDYVCNDYVEAVFGDYDDAVCGAHDLYENRQAIACLFTGCYEQTSTPQPPVYTYDFTQTWKATFGLQPNSAVVSWSDGSKLTCIKCGLSLSEFQLKGEIVAVLDTKQLRDATLTVTENSETDMIFQLDAVNPLAYNWSSSLSTGNLDSISVDGVFTLTPNVVFSMGVEFSADTAISVQGGASLFVNDAEANVQLSTLDTKSNPNWAPSLQTTDPTFTKSAKVELIPYVRRLIAIEINILNQPSQKISFGSVSALGYTSEWLDADGAVCPANTLQLKSYLYNTNSIIYGDNAYSSVLGGVTRNNPDQCFHVPSDKPTQDEINQLRSTAQAFCTAYNQYLQPTSATYLVSTTTTPTTTITTTTSTVQAIPTVTATTSTTAGKVRTIYITASITSNAGDESLDSTYLQKRGTIQTPTAMPSVSWNVAVPEITGHAQVEKRQIVTPALVSTWNPTKISYACSQVATGTTTVTFYTRTATAYNGTITSTSTVYTAFQGPAVTSYTTLTSYAWSTTTSTLAAQKTVPASCPLQSQVSCFTVTGHGPSSIDGKYLHVKPGVLNPSFDSNPTVFYLSCEGKLTALPDLRVLGGPGGTNKVAFNTWGPKYASKCTRDSTTGVLDCLQDGGNIMYAWTPPVSSEYWIENNLLYVSPRDDDALWIPTWGFQAASSEYNILTLSTQSVTCPCTLDTSTEAIASVDASTPSCPASDGTRYKSADGNVWQIQCSTSYSDSARQTTSAPSLISCLNLCDNDHKCTGAVWDSTSNSCTLKSSMLSDNYPIGDTVHSVIRLLNPPTCPSSGSNLINNGGFEGGLSPWTATVKYETPSAYGIRSPGYNSGNAYHVQFSGNLVELELDYSNLYLVGGVDYTISGNFLSDSNAASSVYCYVANGQLSMIPGQLSGGQVNQWQTSSYTFTASASGTYTMSCYWVGNSGQNVWIDNIALNC